MMRLYRWALRLLPREFRAGFGDALLDEASTCLTEAEGAWPRIRAGARLGTDLLKCYVREWGDVLRGGVSNLGGGVSVMSHDTVIRNLRFAVRTLGKSPTFTCAAVLLIALGVGAVTAVFAVIDQVLLQPLPYPEQDRLAFMTNGSHNGPTLRGLDDISAFDAWTATAGSNANVVRGGGEPAQVRSVDVTPAFFSLFGARPVLGRVLVEGDYADRSVTVVTSAAWETLWGADPGLVGSTITVDSQPVTVVGVLTKDFASPERLVGREAQLFRPMNWDNPELESPGTRRHSVVVRIASGVDLSSAQAQVDRLADDLFQRSLLTFTRQTPSWPLVPLRDATTLSARSGLFLLLASVSLLLLVACANVALLFMTRGVTRTREMSVRRALGAGTRTLVGQLIAESLLVGGLGVLLALGLARVALAGFGRWIGDLPRGGAITLDVRVFLFAVLVAAATALVFGLLPALSGVRGNVSAQLRESGRTSTEGPPLRWARRGLVVGEVGISVVLVALAGLLLRSFNEVTAQHPGVEPENVWTIVLNPVGLENVDEYRSRMDRVLAALEAVPGVRAVTYGNEMPFQFVGGSRCCEFRGVVRTEGSEENILQDRRGLPTHYVTASFFETLGVDLRAGSVWGPVDVATEPPPAIVSERLAIEAFGSESAAVGQELTYGGGESFTTARIVGVAGPTLHYGLDETHAEALYVPIETYSSPLDESTTFAIKLSGSPEGALPSRIRGAIWSVEPNLPVPNVQPLSAWINDSLGVRRLSSALSSAFGAVALFLAAGGLYGTLLYATSQRRRELGIRMALGAESRQVQGDVLASGLALGAVGVAIGVPSALLLSRFLRSWLWGVSPSDPLAIAGGSLVLLSVAAAASWLPAYRASRTDPLEVLRAE